jgi:hypothetical protein
MRFTACLRAFFMSESRAKTNKKPTDIIKCSAGSNVKIYVCILYAKISYLDTTLMPQQDTTGRSNARYVMIGSNGIYFRKITVTFQIPGGKNQLPFSNSFCGVNPACHAKQNRPH